MRFHNVLRVAVLLLGAATPIVALGQFQAPTKEELAMTSDPQAPGAAAVYLYREETENDPLHFRTVYARIKVLSEKGKELATVHIAQQRDLSFSASGSNRLGEDQQREINLSGQFEVAAISGRTIHPDGTVIPLDETPADLLKTRQTNNPSGSLTFTLPGVEVGSILEYRYQLRYDRFQTAPLWEIQQPYFVHRAHYLFTPATQFLPTDTTGPSRTTDFMYGPHGQLMTDVRAVSKLPAGKTLQQDALGRFVLDVTDIPPIPEEPFAPPLEGQIYQVNFYYTYTFVQKEFWQKEMQFWNKEVNQYTTATDAIRQAVSSTVNPSDSEMDKARKLYALVQSLDNTDFTDKASTSSSDSSVPAGNVETVLQHKSGNSQQIALLYLALARAAGLDASAQRIASRDRRLFSPDYLSADQLDSLVVVISMNGKDIFLDPGEKMAPFQTLKWTHAGAAGVALKKDGKSDFTITPLQQYSDNTSVRVGELAVSAQGSVSGMLKVGFTGQKALHWRQRALQVNSSELNSELEAVIAKEIPDGAQAHVTGVSGLDNPSTQLVVHVQISGSIAKLTGNRLILPRMFFESKKTDPFAAENARILPVDMQYAEEEQEQITYGFPGGFTLEAVPQDSKLNWENYAYYQLRSKVDPGSVTNARVYARGFTFLDPKEYGQLRDYYKQITAADRQQLVLKAVQ